MPKKYDQKTQQKVKEVMHEFKEGELKSGKSNKKVKSRKQAVAIGLSEAREAGGKVPANPAKKNRKSRASAEKKAHRSPSTSPLKQRGPYKPGGTKSVPTKPGRKTRKA